MKTNGHTIYYLNNEDNTIEVVQSPLSADAKNIDLTKTTLLSQIVLPKTINGQKNLFLHNNTLVLLAQWQSSTPGSYKFIDKSNKLMVITYDVSNPKGPKLMKVVSLDGSYMDARLVDGTLRIVAQQYFNRRYTTDDKAPTLQSSKIFPRVTQRESSSKRSQIFTPLCNSIQYVLPDEDKDHMVYPNFTYIYTVPLANSTKPGINVLL